MQYPENGFILFSFFCFSVCRKKTFLTRDYDSFMSSKRPDGKQAAYREYRPLQEEGLSEKRQAQQVLHAVLLQPSRVGFRKQTDSREKNLYDFHNGRSF